jgi:DNA-binding NarL/FixJ family response regulator
MSTARVTRVFLVDDHPLVREWLTTLISRQPDLVVCGEAESTASALRAIPQARPDVAIVDLSLDGRSGLELIRELRLLHPAIVVLVLSMHDEMSFAERALRAGARGYVMKREATKQVILAIRRVQEGGVWVSARVSSLLAEKAAAGVPPGPASPIERLSERELEVFRLLGQGQATRQIAGALHVSAKTVQTYCARVKVKFGLASSTQLLREAIHWHEEPGSKQD